MLIVREFTFHDMEAVTDLMTHLGYPTLVDAMHNRMKMIHSNPMNCTFIAEYSSKVVGLVGLRKVILYESDYMAVQIAALVTQLEQYRGLGIGKALVRHAEEWAKDHGATQIYLTSGNRRVKMPINSISI